MDNERIRHAERRKHIRYQCPQGKRPILEIAGSAFPVLDICERGLRIHTSPSMGFVEGAMIDATIRLGDRDAVALSGTVVQQQGPHAGIFLAKAIRDLLKTYRGTRSRLVRTRKAR